MDLSPQRKNKKGQMVHSNQKMMIINLYKKIKLENPALKKKDILPEISKSVGIGITTIGRTILEYEKEGVIRSPNKKKIRLQLKDKLDEFEKTAICRKVDDFYLQHDTLPSIDKILKLINDDDELPNFKRGSLYCLLYCLLKGLGYNYCKRDRPIVPIEREDLL